MKKVNVALDYKDKIFRTLFSDKASLLQLYNALNGTEYTDETDLVINDLEDAIYMSMKNDKSFILDGRIMNFYEHQSTFSPNLPLRGFVYAAKCYDAEEAIEIAIDYCIEENVLREFLKKNRSEVMGSILTEYNEKETMEAFYRDGKEEGKAEGEAEEKLKTASKLKAKNMPIEEIAEITELSVADIEKL